MKDKNTLVEQKKQNSDQCESGYYESQQSRLVNAKKKIAEYAVTHYLAPDDSIVIDAGSSLCPIASAIATSEGSNYTIMTHNFNAFIDEELQQRAKESKRVATS